MVPQRCLSWAFAIGQGFGFQIEPLINLSGETMSWPMSRARSAGRVLHHHLLLIVFIGMM